MTTDTVSRQCCAPITEAGITQDEAKSLATRLKALSDPARLRLISLIASNGEMCVCDLTEPLGLSQPTVSHHLKVLSTAGLVHREKRGKWAHFRVDHDALNHVAHSLLGTSAHVSTGDSQAVTRNA
jgi:ArsR family transcriptional regulator, arsenate/arsenite/antimonite-responsive transcriptional repressor